MGFLYVLQPIVRGWNRQTHLLRNCYLPPRAAPRRHSAPVHKISASQWDLYWRSDENRGREQLLVFLARAAAKEGWRGDFDDGWSQFDLKLAADCWHDIRVLTATEELGWPNRFTRARCVVTPTPFAGIMLAASAVWLVVSAATMSLGSAMLGSLAILTLVLLRSRSRRRCLRSISELVWRCAAEAGLQPYDLARGDIVVPSTVAQHESRLADVHEESTHDDLLAGASTALGRP